MERPNRPKLELPGVPERDGTPERDSLIEEINGHRREQLLSAHIGELFADDDDEAIVRMFAEARRQSDCCGTPSERADPLRSKLRYDTNASRLWSHFMEYKYKHQEFLQPHGRGRVPTSGGDNPEGGLFRESGTMCGLRPEQHKVSADPIDHRS